jgi:hypothetical protein
VVRAARFGLSNAWRPLDPHQGSWRGHSQLSQGSWRGVDLRELVRQEFEPFAKAASALTDGPTIVLPPDIAQAVSLTLHDLATDAAKFGALSQAPGQLSVRWTCEAVGIPEGRLVIDWRESGGPEVMPGPSQLRFEPDPRAHLLRSAGQLGRARPRAERRHMPHGDASGAHHPARVRQGRLPAILFKWQRSQSVAEPPSVRFLILEDRAC